MTNSVSIYDTTLHNSKTWAGLPLQPADLIYFVTQFDSLGLAYIEFAAPEPEAPLDFFEEPRGLELNRAKLAVYGSLGEVDVPPAEDSRLAAMLATGFAVCTLSANTCKSDLLSVPNPSPAGHLGRAQACLNFLKASGREVIFAADHFFDGFKEDPAFALAALGGALKGGADVILLCDTRGNALPWEVAKTIHEVQTEFSEASFGIGAGNQGNSATANIIAAAGQGVGHIQGSINGYSERSGMANLCQIIPDLELRMGFDCLAGGDLADLVAVSSALAGVVEKAYLNYMPYVGKSEAAPV